MPDVPVIILCGGEGRRLRPHTENTPKPLLLVKEKPIMQWHIERFSNAGHRTFYLCTGYKHDIIENHFKDGSHLGVKINYNIENEPLGTAGPVKALEKHLNGTFILVNGDNVTNVDPAELLNFHKKAVKEKGILATVTLVQLRSPYGIVEFEGELGKRFVEKPLLPHWLNAGVTVFEPQVLDMIPEKGQMEERVFPLLAERGQLAAYLHRGYWKGVDTVKDFEEVQKDSW